MNRYSFTGALVFLGVALAPHATRASETYPAAVQEELGLACAPACVLCHNRPEGGFGFLNTGFGATMLSAGLIASNPDLIPEKLRCLETGEGCPEGFPGERPDSDRDGTPDVAELRNGDDPNSTGKANSCGPSYGCGARIEPNGRLDGVAAGAALLAAAGLIWSFRRRRSS